MTMARKKKKPAKKVDCQVAQIQFAKESQAEKEKVGQVVGFAEIGRLDQR